MEPIEAWLEQAGQARAARKRPLVTLSYAQSLDGSLAARRGQPLALSGPESLRLTHRLRAAHDAILAGIGTVLADDPSLTVRLAPGRNPQPVILDSTLRFPLGARLLRQDAPLPWIAGTPRAHPQARQALEAAGARVLELPEDEAGGVSLPALLDCLAAQGVRSLMVEGGARVITSFLAQNLADLAVLTIAPRFVGGLPSVEGLPGGVSPHLEDMQVERLGADLVVWGRIAPHEPV